MRTWTLALFLTLATSAALAAQVAPFGSQDPQDTSFAASWGCTNHPTSSTIYVGLPPMPSVGESVCEILTRTGKPARVTLWDMGNDDRTAVWVWEAKDGSLKAVTMGYTAPEGIKWGDPGGWVVTTVSW